MQEKPCYPLLSNFSTVVVAVAAGQIGRRHSGKCALFFLLFRVRLTTHTANEIAAF